MTTIAETVLAAMSIETPMTRHELEEATGLELQPISNTLSYLKGKGLIANPDGRGWRLADGSPMTATTVAKVAAREAATAPVEPNSAKAQKRAERQPKAPSVAPRSPPATPMPVNGRACEFAIAESGAILFKVTKGPRAGELGEIGHVDAMALYRLMSAVDFITENA